MNTLYIIVAVVLVIAGVLASVVVGLLLAQVVVRRKRAGQIQGHFGSEYDRTLEALGNAKKAQAELNERQKHIETLDIRSLSRNERERYLAEWSALQLKFIDEPRQAIVDADHLIMEVMQLRDYPVSNFEERAADISVKYPALVSNYRAAQEISLKNKRQQANTEELRRAVICYRSLFDELLETKVVAA